MGKTLTKKGGQGKGNGTRRTKSEGKDFVQPRKRNGLGAVEADTTAVVRLVGKRITLFGLLKEPPAGLFQSLPGFLKATYSAGPTPKLLVEFDTTENAAKSCDMLVVNHPVELDDYLPLDNTEWHTPDMEKLSKLAAEPEAR